MVLNCPQLYAKINGIQLEGPLPCHWCGSPCREQFQHDDVPPQPGFQRNPHKARCVASPFICSACWLWRRTRITATSLRGTYRDIQSPRKLNWLFTASEARAVEPEDLPLLLKFLLRPALPFALMLLDDPAVPNQLHLGTVNEQKTVEAATPLSFTLNNNLLAYTVYELEEALRTGDATGTEPGTRALHGLLTPIAGKIEMPDPLMPAPADEDVKRGKGRPKQAEEKRDAAALKKQVPAAA